MFYQDNNDYMRDALYYSTPQNSTYQYGYVPNAGQGMYGQNMAGFNNMVPVNNYGMQTQPISTMYPQVYKIINPVASRIIANSNYQYLTEEALNSMVNTVFNIVEGDVSSLLNTETMETSTSGSSGVNSSSGDDTVTQGPARGNTSNGNGANSSMNNTPPNSNPNTGGNNRPPTTTGNGGVRQLLRDLIKIIIIKNILGRQPQTAYTPAPYNNYYNF